MNQQNPLLELDNLKTYFRLGSNVPFLSSAGVLKAVDGISFKIHEGEVLSLVGESGCGKSTVGRTITRLEQATSGSISFGGNDMLELPLEKFRVLRRDIQMIFQDPFASLNPRLTIEQTLAEPIRIHGIARGRKQINNLISETLDLVGLDPQVAKRYPHEFSGGQRQRIGIARVMVLRPKLVIADEAVSALDVSIQAQVLNLIRKLQREHNISMLFISHDLGVVRHVSDRVAVMYLGRIVEIGTRDEVFENPSHPYTRLLLSSIPRVNPGRAKVEDLGEPASALSPPQGCSFHPRCAWASPLCKTKIPELQNVSKNQMSACHHIEELHEETV